MTIRQARPFYHARWLFPEAIFRIRSSEKAVLLTFDDGPSPESTPDLLGILDSANVRAIFFCNGKAAEKYPDLVNDMKRRGHIVGNHGYDHISGWSTSIKVYCDNAERASHFTSATLFRPPYGRLRIRQYRSLRKSYRIFFWDIMSFDYDLTFGAERSLELLKRKLRSGSVIVLHDTPASTCRIFLKEFIDSSRGRGYKFCISA
jgi:peptidoglycan/xylan/chitin deacetylase (PgdA/CDA1 family)